MKLSSIAGVALVYMPAVSAVDRPRELQGSRPGAAVSCQHPDRSEVLVPGGMLLMGAGGSYAEEGPIRHIFVATFWMDRFDVTNRDFARFVAATGYVTDAERKPDPADFPEVISERLIPGGAVFSARGSEQVGAASWQFKSGASWRHPDGPGSDIDGRDEHPVVQVSYRDAAAYARWVGRELPTEEQYEYAARGGLRGKSYGWGDELTPNGEWMANTWQGTFPSRNTVEDGFAGRAPAGCFPPNGYGLYDMIGNVWKWTSSRYVQSESGSTPPARVLRAIKGGSFLCSSTFCRRFRPAARQPQESGFSSLHLGFRTVRNSQRVRTGDHG